MKIILSYIIVAITFLSLGVGATLLYSAKDIEYKDTNVEEALNELTDDYLANEADLVWTNPYAINVAFPAQTLNIDLTKYEYIAIDASYNGDHAGSMNKSIIKVGTSGFIFGDVFGINYSTTYRKVDVTTTGITVTTGLHYNNGNHSHDTWATPRHIWGIKHLTIN